MEKVHGRLTATLDGDTVIIRATALGVLEFLAMCALPQPTDADIRTTNVEIAIKLENPEKRVTVMVQDQG